MHNWEISVGNLEGKILYKRPKPK